MNIISHRGNLNGRIPERENSPDYIDEAIEAGFEVEIDVFSQDFDDFWLGHDEPVYKVHLKWLEARSDFLWCHCKTFSSLSRLIHSNMNCFFIDKDDFAITSYGYIWCKNFENNFGKMVVVPAISKEELNKIKGLNIYGAFTDYPIQFN